MAEENGSTLPPAAPSQLPAAGADANAASSNAMPGMPQMYPKPVTMLIIGMAGSGKTTLMQVRQRSLAVPVGTRLVVDIFM